METSITINLKDGTCDIEVRGLSLGCINNLSAITQAVADNIKSTLIISGADSKKAGEAANLLLQGKHDIQGILKGVFRDP